MPIEWNLRKWLAVNHDIYRPSELQALLAERLGVRLSLQAISALMNNKPHALRMQTVQALCNALNCKLSDFCDVLPDSSATLQRQRKVAGTPLSRLYGSTKESKPDSLDDVFPDPRDFKKRGKG